MDALLFLGLGLVVGVSAPWVLPRSRRAGLAASVGFGMLGALAGGFFGRAFFLHDLGPSTGLVMSVVGAMVLLLAYATLAPWKSTK